jgi:hypothetical protein
MTTKELKTQKQYNRIANAGQKEQRNMQIADEQKFNFNHYKDK